MANDGQLGYNYSILTVTTDTLDNLKYTRNDDLNFFFFWKKKSMENDNAAQLSIHIDKCQYSKKYRHSINNVSENEIDNVKYE